MVDALIQLNSWEAIRGIGVWLKPIIGTTPLWVTAAEAQAKGSYEAACESYRKAMEMLPPGRDIDGPVMDFIISKVSQYSRLCTSFLSKSDIQG